MPEMTDSTQANGSPDANSADTHNGNQTATHNGNQAMQELQHPEPAYQPAHIPTTSVPVVPYHDPFETDPRRRRYNLLRTEQFIWLTTSTLEMLYAMRFVLKLIDANPGAGFAQFIYNVTAVFLLPFNGLTVTPSANGSVFEFSTLIAMVVYALFTWAIVRIMWVLFEAPTVQ